MDVATINQVFDDEYAAYHGDCIEVLQGIPDESVDYSIYSPPFASLYTYSDSPRDMGNAASYEEFFEHYDYLAQQLYRVLKPGRLISIHCMLIPAQKGKDGFIGLRDFRGDLIRSHQRAGMIHHSEVVIWKDPVVAMQRTKALGLLYKQIRKDSAMGRQGVPDYLVTMRKPGDNPEPVTKDAGEFSVDTWQKYASPVWMDINMSDTLQYMQARSSDDERHIAPLQLGVIQRAVRLWTNPDDVVLTPFMGIGSEAYVAVKMGRRAIGIELKESYFNAAIRNLNTAVVERGQGRLLDLMESEEEAEHVDA